jgi:hypothetical protein
LAAGEPSEEDEAEAGDAIEGKRAQGDLRKLRRERDAARAEKAALAGRLTRIDEELAELDALRKTVADLQSEPLAPRAGLFVVDKSADGVQPLGGGAGAAGEPPTPEQAIKAALARPQRMYARFGG